MRVDECVGVVAPALVNGAGAPHTYGRIARGRRWHHPNKWAKAHRCIARRRRVRHSDDTMSTSPTDAIHMCTLNFVVKNSKKFKTASVGPTRFDCALCFGGKNATSCNFGWCYDQSGHRSARNRLNLLFCGRFCNKTRKLIFHCYIQKSLIFFKKQIV